MRHRLSRAGALLFAVLLVATTLVPQFVRAEDPLEEVLVTGDQPGPSLWKVTNGENTLWILGSLSPLPTKMHWRSRKVEDVVAQSQEVLGEPNVSGNIGFFRGIRLLPSLLRARANPDGAVLKDLLPADLYARWAALKQRHIGRNDKIERWRPMFAAQELYEQVLKDSGLSERGIVWPVVTRAAKQHHIKLTNPAMKVEIDDPKQLIKDFGTTSRELDIACLAATLDRIEHDLDGMRQRANAWSTGDIETLRRTPEVDRSEICLAAATSVASIHEKFEAARDAAIALWMTAADTALKTNRSSFTVLSMADLFGANGRLAQLRARGYQVEAPISP